MRHKIVFGLTGIGFLGVAALLFFRQEMWLGGGIFTVAGLLFLGRSIARAR
jgi:hypothetical protein